MNDLKEQADKCQADVKNEEKLRDFDEFEVNNKDECGDVEDCANIQQTASAKETEEQQHGSNASEVCDDGNPKEGIKATIKGSCNADPNQEITAEQIEEKCDTSDVNHPTESSSDKPVSINPENSAPLQDSATKSNGSKKNQESNTQDKKQQHEKQQGGKDKKKGKKKAKLTSSRVFTFG